MSFFLFFYPIPIILFIVILHLWNNTYEYCSYEGNCSDKLTLRIWHVVTFFIITLIPILNYIILIVTLFVFIINYAEEDLFYHLEEKRSILGKLFKFLNKPISKEL